MRMQISKDDALAEAGVNVLATTDISVPYTPHSIHRVGRRNSPENPLVDQVFGRVLNEPLQLREKLRNAP